MRVRKSKGSYSRSQKVSQAVSYSYKLKKETRGQLVFQDILERSVSQSVARLSASHTVINYVALKGKELAARWRGKHLNFIDFES